MTPETTAALTIFLFTFVVAPVLGFCALVFLLVRFALTGAVGFGMAIGERAARKRRNRRNRRW